MASTQQSNPSGIPPSSGDSPRFGIPSHLSTDNSANRGLNLGQSQKNKSNKERAIFIFDSCARKMGMKCFDKLTLSDVPGEEEMSEIFRKVAVVLTVP